MFKHCKHRDKISIHKIFSKKFLPRRAFSKIPFTFLSLIGASLTLASSIFPKFALSSPFPPFTSFNTLHVLLPYTRTHTHTRTHVARARLRSHAHARYISPNIINSYYTTKERKEKYFFTDIFKVKVDKTHCKSDSYK